jgi:hypothetical protein
VGAGAVQRWLAVEAVKTGILPLMWFCRLCTAGVNIFGIAMQVPFGKEMGFGGGIVALAMNLKAFINGTDDQKRPRRCGHVTGKQILPIEE